MWPSHVLSDRLRSQGLIVTAAAIHNFLHSINIPIHVQEVRVLPGCHVFLS